MKKECMWENEDRKQVLGTEGRQKRRKEERKQGRKDEKKK